MKKQNRVGNYVVIKHQLRDMNGNIAGVKFRSGYAVVEKDSKIYNTIKKLPLLKNQPELPLLHLKDLPFITRALDVKLVYGPDVYNKYMSVLNEYLEQKKVQDYQENEQKHIENNMCKHRSSNDALCYYEAIPLSPGGFCKKHILHDPIVEELLGQKIPKRLANDEKREWKDRALQALEKLAK